MSDIPDLAIFSEDIREDGSIEGIIFTQFFPLSEISLVSPPPTVRITGDGFQRVEIRIPVKLFLDAAKKISERGY